MQFFSKGRYRARLANGDADIAASQRLRALAFVDGLDVDAYDARCDHVLVEEVSTGALVASYRLMQLASGAQIGQSYSAQFYDLAALQAFDRPMLELGRFCIHPDHSSPEILRAAWAAMTRIVDGRGVRMLFVCTSFAGCDANAHSDAFALLKARHLAPAHWQPLIKAPDVVRFVAAPFARNVLRKIPPLLRTYLAMGGWVSDHAVIDHAMNTLHVFTGVEISTIPEGRKRILRAQAVDAARPTS